MKDWVRRSAPLWVIFVAVVVAVCWIGGIAEHWGWISQVLPVCVVISALFALTLLGEHKTEWAWRQLPLGYRFRFGCLLGVYFLLWEVAAGTVSRVLPVQARPIYATGYWAATAAILLITLALAASDVARVAQKDNHENGIRRLVMAFLVILGVAGAPVARTGTPNPTAVLAYVVWAVPLLLFYLGIFPFKPWHAPRTDNGTA